LSLDADERPRPEDEAIAGALEALANPLRLAMLRDLRTPRMLTDVRLRPTAEGGPLLARQSVRRHLDRLLEARLLVARAPAADEPGATRYMVNHASLFALSEEVASLARLAPREEPSAATQTARLAASPLPAGPCLVLVHGPELGREFPLDADAPGPWRLGRRRDLEVPLDFDPYVSAVHAEVAREGTNHRLVDLPGSRNGTLLNFQALPRGARVLLRHGDVVGAGRSLLLYRAG
jgi:hypothetical protein